VQGGVVVKGNYGNLTMAASIAGGHGDYDSTRLAFNGAVASSEQAVDSISAQLRVAYAFDRTRWYWRPMLDLNYADVRRDAFVETGAGVYNLQIQAGDDTFVTVQPQIEAGYDMPVFEGGLARWYARLGVTQYLTDAAVDVSATMAGAPVGVTPLTVTQSLDETLGDVGLGVDLFSAGGMVLRIGYNGQFSSHSATHGGMVKFSIPF
jgi:outer membrane autotransporter protein